MSRHIEEPKDKNIGSSLYASGRVAMLEEKLIPGNLMESLPYSESETALMHKISAVYQGDSLDEALEAAEIADIKLYTEIAAEAAYIKMLLIPKEAHNIRRVMKLMLASDSVEVTEDDGDFLCPYLSGPDQLYNAVKTIAAKLSLDKKFKEVRFASAGADKPLPEWQKEAIADAIDKFNVTDEASEISAAVDKAALRRMIELAKESQNPWLMDWVVLNASLADLGLVLRCRHLDVAPEVAMMRASKVSAFTALELSELAAADDLLFSLKLKELLKKIPAITESEKEELRSMAIAYGEEGPAAFSALTDRIKIEVLRKAAKVFGRPEQVFAYFSFREFERKNLRLVLAGVANNLDPERVKKMLRPSFRREALR